MSISDINEFNNTNTTDSQDNQVNEGTLKSFKILVVIIFIILICFLGFYVYNLIKCYLPKWRGRKLELREECDNSNKIGIEQSNPEVELGNNIN